MDRTTAHPDDAVVLEYLDGELDPFSTRAFEAHVEGCSTCAARLQAEARLELALYEAAELATPPTRRVGLGWVEASVAALAVAAAVLLILFDPGRLVHVDAMQPTLATVQTEMVAVAGGGDRFACLPPTLSDGPSCEDVVVALATFPPEDFERGGGLDEGALCTDDSGDELVCTSPGSFAG